MGMKIPREIKQYSLAKKIPKGIKNILWGNPKRKKEYPMWKKSPREIRIFMEKNPQIENRNLIWGKIPERNQAIRNHVYDLRESRNILLNKIFQRKIALSFGDTVPEKKKISPWGYLNSRRQR